MKKYLAASLAVFVWLLVFDNFLVGIVMGSALAQIPGMLAEYSRLWEAVGDLCIALVATGLYARVRGVFGASLKGGAVYGVYAGLLAHFPTWLFHTLYAGWPYAATWHMTIVLVAVAIVAGAVMGAVYQAMERPATA